MSNPTFIPYIVVSNAAAAIDFYKAAFGAVELARHAAPNSDKLMHASMNINGGVLMMSDDFSASMGGKSQTPEALGGSPVTFHLQVADADAVWAQAVAAGAEVTMPLADQFWGDRYGQLRDPFGHRWSIGQTVARPTKEEVEEAAKAVFK
ncbi:MAG TPA: VOC family protein [Terracidiphilus sp.]|nr:VOC family protein [Terracidiphilus sp.]